MKFLVTAGNTMTFVDRVRCITNVFSGRTGASLAGFAAARGHTAHLLTSRPDVANPIREGLGDLKDQLTVETYQTFSDLQRAMESHVTQVPYDAIIHSAAVSDFDCAGAFTPSPGTRFDPVTSTWNHAEPANATLVKQEAGKIKSDAGELWLRLVQTPKLVDQIRAPWGFRGILVKFKLEVDVSDEQLLAVGEQSRCHSGADLMVANTLEGMRDWAMIGPVNGQYQRVERSGLAERVIEIVERLGGRTLPVTCGSGCGGA
jgi:phosphopantothenoylcysteine synthetase/decarboxylase